jgi:hypothetical protein
MAEVLRLMVAPPPALRWLMFPRAATRAVATAAETAVAAVPAFAVATNGRMVGGGPALQIVGYAIVVAAALVRIPQTWSMWRTKEVAPLNPLSAEVEMFFYTVQVLNGLRLKKPFHAFWDDLAHTIIGAATTAMLYAYAKPDSTQSVTKTRKVITWAVMLLLVATGIPGVLPSVGGHYLHQFFELVPPLPPTWRLLMRFCM